MTACCLAMTWACQTKATDIKLIEKMHKARISPICVSEAGTPNTRRIQAIKAPEHYKLSEPRKECNQWANSQGWF